MSADFKVDLSEFNRALKFVEKATGKDSLTLLNRAALHAIIGGKGVKGAMQRTPKADRAKINAVNDKVLAGAVAKRLKAKGIKVATADEFRARVKKERRRRIRSTGYTAFAGWSNAAKAFGGKGVRGVQGGFRTKAVARHGWGRKAKPVSLTAIIANTAPAAEKIGEQALQDAINDVARDLVEYGTRKIQQTLAKASSK